MVYVLIQDIFWYTNMHQAMNVSQFNGLLTQILYTETPNT